MIANKSTYDFIRSPLIEGEKLKAYKCTSGVWTIGCGVTSINNIPVKDGLIITQERSEELFYKEAIRFTKKVNVCLEREISQKQWNVLFSVCWNYGCGWYSKKRLIVAQFNKDPLDYVEIKKILNLMDNKNRRMNELKYLTS